jgi:formylglycine-generating enzyme required for sulfatase activity
MATTETSQPKPKAVIKYRDRTAQFYTEDRMSLVAGQTPMDMVYIPPGTFQMGSPENELRRSVDEGPQHPVAIAQPFFMGKHAVTQAQWKAVAQMNQIEREITLDPSNFKGDNRPVEQIDWHDAVEFCRRLAKETRRHYRLPTEAEWEYACRAGTTTPFHFGASISTDLANYQGTDWDYEGNTYSGAYGEGPHGEYREETTEVGRFKVANAFGLYDMHGNVWEWCQDTWHENYEGAPEDGSAWINENDNDSHVLRGGSWDDVPVGCRSAYRGRYAPDDRYDFIGLRVVCGVA